MEQKKHSIEQPEREDGTGFPLKFLGYKRFATSGLIVAIFEGGTAESALKREYLEAKLEDLKRRELPCGETEKALSNWPTQEEAVSLPSAEKWMRSQL
ncbi:MAG: hypothetical protein AAB897_02725 [Patescibacteria group bacterium]